ncbi:unnamed protein product [Discosporangium mesarthrocarpum]
MGSRGGNMFFRSGLPLVVFIVGGSCVLSQFVSGQVDVKDMRRGSKSLREFNLEEEHRRTMREFDEDFEITRIPRPEDRNPG